MNFFKGALVSISGWRRALRRWLAATVYVGKHKDAVGAPAVIFFPQLPAVLCCGLAGIVAFKGGGEAAVAPDLESLEKAAADMAGHCYESCRRAGRSLESSYLCGAEALADLLRQVRIYKQPRPFYAVFQDLRQQQRLEALAGRFTALAEAQTAALAEHVGRLDARSADVVAERIEALKDIVWCIRTEVLQNVRRMDDLLDQGAGKAMQEQVDAAKKINAVLNSIDRLEVRGRDSAGLSLMFVLAEEAYRQFAGELQAAGLAEDFQSRLDREVLINRSISLGQAEGSVTVVMTYKVAAEVGRLGDNVSFLRDQVRRDAVLQRLMGHACENFTVLSHTRWASVGAINEANCHPVDNRSGAALQGIIHVCLNGDIDNYLDLKRELERDGAAFPAEITTDTKVIPLQIQKYLRQGADVTEAFRRAVNDFDGSHAISMHTDLDPGKVYLAQRGSGQAIFVGLAETHYMPTSEVYGFVEETPAYLKMDGETVRETSEGPVQGQIFVLDQNHPGNLEGIQAMFYDATPVSLTAKDVKLTAITSRDIDRQGYYHYFLKEISESPASVEKTLQNRWKQADGRPDELQVTLGEPAMPRDLQDALGRDSIRRIFFIGQGTAGVAALACANILQYYLDDPGIAVCALKASELSGFTVGDGAARRSMADALVVAISQSGTTTDTNRAVDMVKELGARTLAIVNRRDSDITFKVDGVFYTSSGRDIEMSVASTKAFYSQIVAGALLSLHLAALRKRRSPAFVTEEIRRLLELPGYMRRILTQGETIGASARRLAVSKTYWATVGSGPNKASADEIRIKLSELCYKTISSDYVEDKKHIDLSSEPLILVCAAGTRPNVVGDIIKDTAIFKAHKAVPVVIADEGETRFTSYAADVFYVPPVGEHLAPILNTLVGHLWGYYAALAINEGSSFLYRFREDLQQLIDDSAAEGLDVYEVVLEKSFREKVVAFYNDFRRKKREGRFPTILGMETASNLVLLLKYLAGRLPVSDFEIDFNRKGTALNMLNSLFECLNRAIDTMARPVDAIKHQAKTVTVGTSRIREKLEGILFAALQDHGCSPVQLTNSNIIVLKNLQQIIAGINGSILYRIGGLSLLGEPTDETTIEVLEKRGVLLSLPSRVETDARLKGTKRIIVRQGNVYIGKGRKDDRSILVIPVISTSPEAPNMIEHLLLLNISFREQIPLDVKIKALGGKFEHIKNIVQENSIVWQDAFLERVTTDELFGRSAEKIGEFIVAGFK